MRKIVTKTLRETLKLLRETEPALVPVRVRRRPLKTCWGQCTLVCKGGRPFYFTISIDSRIPEPLIVETLIHEWAHAVAWQEGRAVDDHGPEWGVAYARLYQQAIAS